MLISIPTAGPPFVLYAPGCSCVSFCVWLLLLHVGEYIPAAEMIMHLNACMCVCVWYVCTHTGHLLLMGIWVRIVSNEVVMSILGCVSEVTHAHICTHTFISIGDMAKQNPWAAGQHTLGGTHFSSSAQQSCHSQTP